MRRFAILNQKGGVGKTTTVQNIGAGLARLGKQVLLIDLDAQAHLTSAWGVRPEDRDTGTVYDVLRGRASAQEAIIKLAGGVSLIPADIDLSAAEPELTGVAGRDYLLRDALRAVRGFDYVLIDSPPSLGVLTVNALAAVQSVIVPLQPETFALLGLRRLLDTVAVVKQRLNPKLNISGVVLTRFSERKILNRDVLGAIKKEYKQPVFKTAIRECIALAEAPSYAKDIFSYRPRSNGAEDYLRLAREIIRRG